MRPSGPILGGRIFYLMVNLFKSYLNHKPKIDSTAFIAEGARLIGNVSIAKNASIWFNAVLRADINAIKVGEGSNIQDNSVLHVSNEHACVVGKHVTVGHNVNLHACTVEDQCLIGIGTVILTGAKIGKGSLVGAQSLIKENFIVPPGSLVLGSPARIVRKLNPKEKAQIKAWAVKYVALKNEYR